jgi:hypothetical protein
MNHVNSTRLVRWVIRDEDVNVRIYDTGVELLNFLFWMDRYVRMFRETNFDQDYVVKYMQTNYFEALKRNCGH